MKRKIIAAGGLVINAKGELLVIFRRNKWDLPKGKLDEGETIEACATREVSEETGLVNLVNGPLIGVTVHDYFDSWQQEEVTKETYWYAMQCIGSDQLIPQSEEDITEARWVNETELQECLKNTYSNIIEIIKKWKGQ